jgi:hypothetical protein
MLYDVMCFVLGNYTAEYWKEFEGGWEGVVVGCGDEWEELKVVAWRWESVVWEM